jgi:hemoglobin
MEPHLGNAIRRSTSDPALCSVYTYEGDGTQMTRTIRNWINLAAVAAVLTLLPAAEAKEKTLYERLGGKKAITAVVDEFVGRVAADTRINHYFAAAAADPQRLASFKMKLVDQICQASGGPSKYTGKDMKTAHMGMGVAGGDFNALVEDLVSALDKFKVGEKEKGDLLGALGPMKTDIVEK